jgi:hypothetical protein
LSRQRAVPVLHRNQCAAYAWFERASGRDAKNIMVHAIAIIFG